MQHTQQSRPVLPSDGGDLAFGDVLLEWVPQLLEDGGNLGVNVFLKFISRVDPMIQPLKDMVEILLRRRLEHILAQRMFHVELEIVLSQVVQHFLTHFGLQASRLEGPWISRRGCGDGRLDEKRLLSHGAGRRRSRVHTASSLQALGSAHHRRLLPNTWGYGASGSGIARPRDRTSNIPTKHIRRRSALDGRRPAQIWKVVVVIIGA